MHNIKSWLSGSTNVYCTIIPFYYCLKIFGLAPYHLESINGNIRIKCYHYISVLCFLSCYFIIFVVTFYRMEKSYSILRSGELLQFVLRTMMVFFIVSVNFVRRDSIFTFFKLISKFDKETMDMKFKVNHSKKRWFVSAFLGCNFLTFICVYMFSIIVFRANATDEEKLDITITFYLTQTYMMSVYQSIFGAFSIVSRFKILNHNAR